MVTQQKTYEELKEEKNSYRRVLDKHGDMKNSRTYKSLELKHDNVVRQIKSIFHKD